MTAREAEQLLLRAGFSLLRIKGSHHVYGHGVKRIVVPYHASKELHPKIAKQVLIAVKKSESRG